MRRTFVLLVLLFLLPLLAGFVPLPDKTLHSARKAMPTGPARFRVAWNGVPGHLEVVGPGQHRFQSDDGRLLQDPGVQDGEARTNRSLWRLLDFCSPLPPDELYDTLQAAGVDMGRRGWVRLDREGNRLAVTLGAMGETEPDMPQVWFEQATGRVLRVRLGDDSLAEVGPPTASGWPQWIRTGPGEVLQLLSAPQSLGESSPGGDSAPPSSPRTP